MGFHIVSPGNLRPMSPIVSFSFFGLRDNDMQRERKLTHYLQQHHIYASLRYCTGQGGVSVSVHYYTPEYFIDLFLETASQFLEENHMVDIKTTVL